VAVGEVVGRKPRPAPKELQAQGTSMLIFWMRTSSTSPGSASAMATGPVRMWPPGPFSLSGDFGVDVGDVRRDFGFGNAEGS